MSCYLLFVCPSDILPDIVQFKITCAGVNDNILSDC